MANCSILMVHETQNYSEQICYEVSIV